MTRESLPQPSVESLMPLRELAVEALRPFASVGNPMLLDLQNDEIETALQKVDAWEHGARQAARTSDERFLIAALTESLYVKAGFHQSDYLEEVYITLQDLLFDHLERDPSPQRQRIAQMVEDTQAFIRHLMKERGQLEALDQAIRAHEGLDQVLEDKDSLEDAT